MRARAERAMRGRRSSSSQCAFCASQAAFITPPKWFSRVLMNAPAEGTLAWFYNRVLPVFEPSFLRAADGAYAGVRRWRPFEPAVAHAATKRPSA